MMHLNLEHAAIMNLTVLIRVVRGGTPGAEKLTKTKIRKKTTGR